MAYTDIDRPSDYFRTKLYTGNGSTQSITGVGFQPDWVWVKARSGTYGTENHFVYDVIRGANVRLIPNGTTADTTDTTGLSSFDSDGFSSGNKTEVNGSGTEYVAWNWLAGGTASSNTDGSITSSVSANTDSGFSIVSYTGSGANATVGHGLLSAPSMILFKNRSTAYSWIVYHKSLGATKNIYLDLTNASDIGGQLQFNDTEPTSSVFSVGTSLATNKSGDNLIAYCFAEKKGYSKFGSYEGNNSANGSFIYTGFSVSWVMIKNIDTSGTAWVIQDSKRSGSSGGNPANKRIRANASNAEETDSPVDLLSNGFKIRSTGSFTSDANTYIYMAFAESPFVTSTGIPTCAR
jgi:hypothetical protein